MQLLGCLDGEKRSSVDKCVVDNLAAVEWIEQVDFACIEAGLEVGECEQGYLDLVERGHDFGGIAVTKFTADAGAGPVLVRLQQIEQVGDRRAGDPGRPDVALGERDQAWVPVLEVLAGSDEELLDRHGRWYIAE